jgi:hypothetical protein
VSKIRKETRQSFRRVRCAGGDNRKERARGEGKMKKFVVDFSKHGKASLYIVEIEIETDKTFTLAEENKIFGHIFFPRRCRKDNYIVFEKFPEAIMWLVNASDRYSDKLDKQLKEQANLRRTLLICSGNTSERKRNEKSRCKGYTCECGIFNRYPAYVYAHWTAKLTHTCDCGRKYTIRNGKATLIQKEREEKEVK